MAVEKSRAREAVVHEQVFVGDDVALDVYDGGHPLSIVTFESRDKRLPAASLGRFGAGYGQGRFAPLGFNEYLVKRSRNHWYQTPEIDDVIAIINRMARGTRVFTYGSSMGGFAAINFASQLNAERFIALSPLHDVSVGNEAGDTRWSESRELAFSHNLIRSGECRGAEGFVFYSSRDAGDDAHAALIERDTAGTLVPVEYGGHPCSFYLNATYKLKRIIAEVGAGAFDVDDFYRVLEDRTGETFYPYERKAIELDRAGDPDGAVEQIRIATDRNPRLPRLRIRLGDYLRRSGDVQGAEEAYRSVLASHPRTADAHVGLSYVHAARGDFAAAADAMRTAVRLAPKPQYYSRLAEWLIRGDDLPGAEAALLKAIELAPHAEAAQSRLTAVRRRMSGAGRVRGIWEKVRRRLRVV